MVRTRLLALALLTVLPAMGLLVISSLGRQKLAKEHAQERVMTTAQLAAANQEASVRQTRQLLATITQFPFALMKDRTMTERGLKSLRRLSPDFQDLGLLEMDGTVFCHTLGMTNEAALGKGLFEKTVAAKDLTLSVWRDGEVGTNLILQFGYPVMQTNGEMARVMYASLRAGVLAEALTNLALPRGGVANVFDVEGNWLARHPDEGGMTGRSVDGEPFFQRSVAQKAGTFEAAGLDGVERVYGVSAVEHLGRPLLFVTVGIPREEFFAKANEEFIASVLFSMALGGVLLVAARWYANRALIRPIESLVRAADELAAGNLKARTELAAGNSELNLLARRFDEMAANLERREGEIKLHASELEKRVAERTEELQALNTELEAFSYSVSHDLRAPLRHMDGFAQILLADPKVQAEAKTHRHLTTIAASAKQMGALIDSLLTFSRMGRQSLSWTKVDTALLVTEVIAEVSALENGRTIEWKVAKLPEVKGDLTLLRLVWANLLSNAAKYSRKKEKPVVEVWHEVAAGEDVFHVRDNGAGFDMTYGGKLFGVFQRLHRTDEFEGTGIGLANVRRIVTRHGGRVWAEGKPEEGATFSFSLPKNMN